MPVDRFTSAGPLLRNERRTEQWHPLIEGGGSSILTDLNTTQEQVIGAAPLAGVIPTEVSSQAARDAGDYHVIQYDDFVVVYTFPAAEIRRVAIGAGGFEQITLSAPAALSASTEVATLREYTLAANTPLTGVTVDGVTVNAVEYTLAAPITDGERIDLIRSSSEHQYINGPIEGDASGAVININNRKIQLVAIGGEWKWSH